MGDARAQPQISADGRFYWDGTRWAPVPGASVAPSPSKLPGILVLAGAGAVLAGTFLPWLDASAPFVGSMSRNLIGSGDGQFLAVVAVVAGVIGLVALVRGANALIAVTAILLALLAGWIVLVDYGDVSGRVANVTSGDVPIVAEVGPGPYLAGVGVIVWIIGGLVGFARRQPAPAAPMQPQSPMSASPPPPPPPPPPAPLTT